jgi:cytochrome c-type biogenesis protein CcmH
VIRRAFVFALSALALLAAATPALASEQNPTLGELENEIICPTCHTTLALSNAPVADQMREFIRERIAAGDTKSEIKDRLVAEFGEGVLAAPPREGFNLLAWLLPLVGLAVAAAAVGVLVRRWRRAGAAPAAVAGAPSTNGRTPLDPELERRVDEELARFD